MKSTFKKKTPRANRRRERPSRIHEPALTVLKSQKQGQSNEPSTGIIRGRSFGERGARFQIRIRYVSNGFWLCTLIVRRIVPPGRGARMRECNAPVPPCSAFFRLLTSLSYSHAWPFALAKATQVCTRIRTSLVAIEEPPSSRDPTTRPLRKSPRHP